MKRAYHNVDSGSSTGQTPGTDHVTPATTFEQSKLPKVSRKVHACTECQSRKIKCDLAPGKTSCTRCDRKSLKCTVNKSLQSLLQDESEWKTSMEQTTQTLQAAVTQILQSMNMPPLNAFSTSSHETFPAKHRGSMSSVVGNPLTSLHTSPQEHPALVTASSTDARTPYGVRFSSQVPSPNNGDMRRLSGQAAGMAMTRENSQEVETIEAADPGVVSAPMGTLFEVTKLRNLRSNPLKHLYRPATTSIDDDFISAGRITVAEAELLFEHFDHTLNHFLWGGIALVHNNLTSVRESSTLLLAAILTVAALHIPGKETTFDICYMEFVSLVCDSMLDRYHTLDGVRALCIGAFWLSDLSWKLSGHAVRIGTELNLHQSYSRAMRGSSEHVEGARLWYLLYVCDHHFSIAYGRPPVIHEDTTIIHHDRFLQLQSITQADLRLHSQVSIFIILTEMYNTFGPAGDEPLSDADLPRVPLFNAALETWRNKWYSQLAPNPYISSYPAKGVSLHYAFGKLQLNALSLRGYHTITSYTLSMDRRELANMAISCAVDILRLVLEEPDIRKSLVGVPLYLHTMITYATAFLLKVQQKWRPAQLNIDTAHTLDLISRIIDLLSEAKASERHLTYHIAGGLKSVLKRFHAWNDSQDRKQNGGQNVSYMQGGGQGYPMADASFESEPDFGQFGAFAEQMQPYGEQYFPVGYFDVLSNVLPGQ